MGSAYIKDSLVSIHSFYRKCPVYSGQFSIFMIGDFLKVKRDVKAEITAKASSEAFAAADTNDQAAGNTYHAA